ncbi:MAG: DUF4349 domain-containing protein [Chloroflexota bacterium]|nr:DUF4349 domain-containing protein [Chloroflexota bacterium]
MKKKQILVIGLFMCLSLILGACTASSPQYMEEVAEAPMAGYDNGAYNRDSMMVEKAVMEEMEEAAPKHESGSGLGDADNPLERMVIYNADLQIAVENPETAMETIIRMAEQSGGFVVNSNLSRTYRESGSLPRAYLTIRVPAGQMDSIMTEIKALVPDPSEDVIYEYVSGQDVTAEYTDLEARLRNLEAAEEALVALMDRAEDTEDVLNVFDELTYYRGEIEIVKGRMKYLSESVSLSAITVEIIAKESLQPIEIIGWEPKGTVKRAVEQLIKTGQRLVDVAIWLGIYCLPFLIPLGIGVYFLVKIIRKQVAKKKVRKAEELANSEKAEEA